MKAISVYTDRIGANDLELPHLRLYADSAIGRDVMPLFIPDLPLKWQCRICVAVRILRLGKNIAPKFASRYIDAIGLVAELMPEPTADRALTDSGVIGILDSAVTTGQWLECNISNESITWPDDTISDSLDVKIADTCRTFDIKDLQLGHTIKEISRFATVKTGDIIILQSTATTFGANIGMKIDCEINGNPALRLKIK